MAYDDGYYYGQCKIICEAETSADDGRTVSIASTTGGASRSKAITNKVADFLVPGRDRYSVTLLDGNTVKWTGTIEAGYGQCIHVMLADGYTPVIEKEFDKIKDNLTSSDGVEFRFGYDAARDRRGYIMKVDGADTVIPFSSGLCFRLSENEIGVKYVKHINSPASNSNFTSSGSATTEINVRQWLIDNHWDDVINYNDLTEDNFLLDLKGQTAMLHNNNAFGWGIAVVKSRNIVPPTKSYENGILTINLAISTENIAGGYQEPDGTDCMGRYSSSSSTTMEIWYSVAADFAATVVPWLVIQNGF